MDATTLTELMENVSGVIATDGGTATHIGITEAADGSRRTVAVVTMCDAELEQTYRVFSPAPWNSPAWASEYREWTIEVCMGDEWLVLETHPA